MSNNGSVPTVMIVDGTSLYCLSCKELLPLDQFHKERGRGYARNCLECERKRRKLKNLSKKGSPGRPPTKKAKFKKPRPIKPRKTPYATEKSRKKKNHLVTISGGKCHRCGYNEFIAGLAFHHVSTELKSSKQIYNMRLEESLEEIDKCVMLCRCCHTALHAGYWTAKFIKRDGVGWTIKKNSIAICDNNNI